ncbi:Gfo/Idh/MocA family protein [Actinoplanes sp. CA-030573]|uniref:Gfo/Idh/MocA family protein n=1 Tax=Actinoplanes sp. CA-030573 TaxID=3239898 RepID=UPI003D8B287A
MTALLRAGLVGLGTMGRHHARILSHLPGVTLAAIADPAGDTTNAGLAAPIVATLDDLLSYHLDYCVVAVPTALHAPVGLALAHAGIPALIEKPLAPDLPTACALAEAFEHAGLIAAVGHIERYNPALHAMRARLADGQLGTLYQMNTRRQGPYPPRVRDVGVVFDLATHDLDSTVWVTGKPLVSVSARAVSRSGRIPEDLVAIIGELSDGTVTSHLVNWLSPSKERVTIATGERGSLLADTLHGDLTYYANGVAHTEWAAAELFRGVIEGDITRYAIAKKEPLLSEHEAFRDAITGKDTPIVTLWEAATTIAAAEAVLRATVNGTTATPTATRPPAPAARPDAYMLAGVIPSSK